MKLLKLNAIDSTNSYLKNLITEKDIENFTVVIAEHQTKGKGQFDKSWVSDKDKNLTFSILAKFDNLKAGHQFYLNYSISLAIYNVLKYYIPPKLSIKWPNDILSANQKVCGILIENSIKNDRVNYAIIGIGLNVNQVNFPTEVVNASSLKKILKITIDKNEILDKILLEIQYQLLLVDQKKFSEIKQMYEAVLFKKGLPSMFIDTNNKTFLGKIIGTGNDGKLHIELEDESIRKFAFKEIKFT